MDNDGYNHKGALESPHTKHEAFKGLALTRASQLVQDGEVDAKLLQLYMDASGDSMQLVQTYFNLSSPLYFDYTHLVCRTARNGTSSSTQYNHIQSHPCM